MVMPPRRKTNHTHKEKPMQDQTMTIENALQILANVTGAYRGTRDEHRAIEAALNAVIGALQQNARLCEQKADKHDNVGDMDVTP